MKLKKERLAIFISVISLLLALVFFGGFVFAGNNFKVSNPDSFLARILPLFFSEPANPYLAGWTRSGPGGGGFAMQVRVAPKGFFNLLDGERVYLANDMNGLFRSKSVNRRNGAVNSWKHLWNPVEGSIDEMPTKYMTSIAFVRNFKLENQDRIIAGTRDGIFIYQEEGMKWTRPDILLERSDLSAKRISLEEVEGRYPWVGVIKEVSSKSNFLIAGIGDSREAQKVSMKRFGLGAIFRSKDGGNVWEFVKIPQAGADEVVLDIDYLEKENTIHTFITTEKALYYSSDIFSAEAPKFSVLSGYLTTPSALVANNFVELRSFEYITEGNLSNSEDADIALFVALNSNTKKGVYTHTFKLKDIGNQEKVNWKRMPSDDGRFGTHLIQSLAKSPESTLDKYRLFVNNQNRQYLGMLTEESPIWQTVVSEESTAVSDGYYEGAKRIAMGFMEVAPKDLVKSKEPAVYGAWFFGPYYSPGHNNLPASSRRVDQMFAQLHHKTLGSKFYRATGFDEIAFLDNSVLDLKPGNGKIMIAGNPDNGILLSDDWGASWSVTLPYSKDKWIKRYKRELYTAYQFRFNPKNSQCVVGGVGPERFGEIEENQGELMANTSGGFGGSSSWFQIGGGPEKMNGLPNAEIHAVAFDPRVSDSGETGIFLGVRGHGIYYGELSENCRVKEGTSFVKLEQNLLREKIPDVVGRVHYYSELVFDSEDKNILYVARRHPAGGLFRVKLDSNFLGSRVEMGGENAVVKVEEIVRGAINEKNQERCPLDIDQNRYNATGINGVTTTKTHVFASVGYGNWQDRVEGSGACPLKNSTSPLNYYGGIISFEKESVLDQSGRVVKNTFVVGGPDYIGSESLQPFQIGGIAQNPKFKNHIVAITTGGTYPKNRAGDQILAGEEDSKISGLWVSLDSGQIFKFYSWPFPFPNATSLKFFPSGRSMIVPTRGNAFWTWSMQGKFKK